MLLTRMSVLLLTRTTFLLLSLLRTSLSNLVSVFIVFVVLA